MTGSDASGPVLLRCEHLTVRRGKRDVVSDVSAELRAGEIVALLGPSGSGKSTLLRMLTGLSTPSAGEVYWHEKPISTTDVNVSIVFQSFALFPWLTVLENVEAVLKARGMEPHERRRRWKSLEHAVGTVSGVFRKPRGDRLPGNRVRRPQ